MKVIVTTTINEPTKATIEFCKIAERDDWIFLIVGDTKTPHELYFNLEKEYKSVKYLSPKYQEDNYKEISDIIGWKSIQRRNIGFIEAYNIGAEIMATVDDDNIPYENWGKDVYVGKTIELDMYEPECDVFDPLSITKDNYVWHRGFPIELLQKRHDVLYKGKTTREVLIQSDLWDGDPDIDAMARLTFKPIVKYSDIKSPYCSNKISPFNSQNTFIHRKIIPFYSMLPFIGRMDDIWASYIIQYYFPNSVIYCPATVYQDRNVQDLITNLQNEIIGYRKTMYLIDHLKDFETILPIETLNFYNFYKKMFDI
jgi:hypothetical protein